MDKISCGGFYLGDGLSMEEVEGKPVLKAEGGSGSGDMTKAVYDADGAVEEAGGIAAYVEEHGGEGGNTMFVNFTPKEDESEENNLNCDYTAEEIAEAIISGKTVIARYYPDEVVNPNFEELALVRFDKRKDEEEDYIFITFSRYDGYDGYNSYIHVFKEQDTNSMTYATDARDSFPSGLAVGKEGQRGTITIYNENGEEYFIRVNAEGQLTCTAG